MLVSSAMTPVMKHRQLLVLAITTASLLMAIAQSPSLTLAQSDPVEPSPLLPPQPVPPLSEPEQEAVRQLILQELDTSRAIDSRVQTEVNDTFGWTITLLNFLTTVLIAIPIVMGVVAWALRRSIILEIVNETKQQLRQETTKEVKTQLEQQVRTELQKQAKGFQHELEKQKSELIAQLQNLFLHAQQEKDRIFKELTQLTPLTLQAEAVTPPIQQKIRELMTQLELLQSVNPQLALSAHNYLSLGDALCLEKRYDEAIASYNQAINLQPDLVNAWVGKSKILRRLERYEEAIAAINQAIQIAPEHQPAWFGKACTLIKLRQYEEALRAFDRSIAIDPLRGDAWTLRGYVLTKLGQFAEAATSLEKAAELQPDLGGTYYSRAYYHLAQDQLEPSLTNLQKAIDLHPKFREIVKTDPDFQDLVLDERFKQLVG